MWNCIRRRRDSINCLNVSCVETRWRGCRHSWRMLSIWTPSNQTETPAVCTAGMSCAVSPPWQGALSPIYRPTFSACPCTAPDWMRPSTSTSISHSRSPRNRSHNCCCFSASAPVLILFLLMLPATSPRSCSFAMSANPLWLPTFLNLHCSS